MSVILLHCKFPNSFQGQLGISKNIEEISESRITRHNRKEPYKTTPTHRSAGPLNPKLALSNLSISHSLVGWHQRQVTSHILPSTDGAVGGKKWKPQTSQPLQPQGPQSVEDWACIFPAVSLKWNYFHQKGESVQCLQGAWGDWWEVLQVFFFKKTI